MPEPGQGNWHLFLVAAAHCISNDINFVPSSEEVNGSLCDADVALDANDDGGNGPICTEWGESLLDFWSATGS